MRILLTGGGGFIGGGIAAALRAAGHDVVIAARQPGDAEIASGHAIACDMGRDVDPGVWLPRLTGIDAVVNCAGILRERGSDTFAAVHVDAPLALFRGCTQTGVRRVVQISALGDARDAEFIASKHRCDDALAMLNHGLDPARQLAWTVLRPSVVYSAAGSFGGTSLLRALAALPWCLCVPGQGTQQIAPISLEDVGAAVAACLARAEAECQVIELAGPRAMSITEYLLAWRRWLGVDAGASGSVGAGVSAARLLHVPPSWVALACAVGEITNAGPLGNTMRRMLERNNVAAPDALARMEQLLALRPVSLDGALAARPAQVQDRLHAALYFVFPLLQLSLAAVWLASAIVGFVTPAAHVRGLFAQAPLLAAFGPALDPAALGPPLVYAVSLLDAVLGVLVLSRRTLRLAAWLMLASVLGYTLLIGVLWPAVWFDPFGGLVKNIALVPAILVLLAWSRQR